MKKIIILVVSLLFLYHSTDHKNLSSKDLILKDLINEYKGNPLLKQKISKSIFSLKKNNDFEIWTVNIESFKTNNYKAFLYIINNGVIKDKIERINYKYHSGTFELSDNLKTIDNEILYKILLPTSSVPQVSVFNEYFKIDKNYELISLFEFYAEERDCTMGREKGELIKREINFKNQEYILIKKVYEFNCEEFDFVKEIKNLKLISETNKTLNK